MRRVDWHDRANVGLLKVGRLQSQVEYRSSEGERVRCWTYNIELSPQPCGMCLGTGKVLKLLACRACGGDGHSPGKSPAVQRLLRTAQQSYKAGVQQGRALRLKDEPESFALCGECLVAGCNGSCIE